jgi:hypothetical protein
VSETLLSILRGVKEAQSQARELGGEVNPYTHGETRGPRVYGGFELRTVDFDVAVVAAEATQTGGKIGVLVSILGVGVSGESSDQKRSETRVRFSVPIALPPGMP